MALIRQDQQVGIQPAGGFATPAFAMDTMMQAQTWKDLGATAATGFDMVKREFDQDAVRQAQLEAPAMIKRDGKGMVIPPATFEPPGLTSRAYRDAYRTTAFSAYTQSVESDHSAFLQQLQVQHPTDVAAARKAMDERTAATVSGLASEHAPLVTLRLNAMNGQAESRINANVIAETNKVAEETAARRVEAVILSATQLAATPNKFDADTLKLNGAVMTDQFEQANVAMKAAGWSQPRIDKVWQDAKVKTEISRDVQGLRTFTLASGNMTSEELVQEQRNWLDHIEKRRVAMGVDGDAYYSAMMGAFNEATRRNGLRIQINDNDKRNSENERILQQRQALIGAGEREGPQSQELLQSFTRERNAVYNDSSLSTSQRMRRIAGYDGVITQGKADLSTYVGDQLTSMVTQVMTPGMLSPERAKAMVQEIKQVVTDPSTMGYVSTGVRNYGERALATIATNDARMSMTTGMQLGTDGTLSPVDVRKLGRQWLDKGYVSDAPNRIMAHDQLAQWVDASDRAYATKEVQRSDARAARRDIDAGLMPSDPRIEALDASLPAWLPPNGEALDFRQESHRQSLAARVGATMKIPVSAIAEFQSVQMGNPEKAQAAADAAKLLRQTFVNHGRTNDQAVALLNDKLGNGVSSFLLNTERFGGDVALKLATGTSVSTSRQGGQAAPGVVEDMDKAMDSVARKMATGGDLGMWDRLTGLSKEQLEYRRLQGDKAVTFMGNIGNAGSPQLQSVEYSKEFRDQLKQTATVIMRNHGQTIKTANPQTDANEIALLQAMESHRGEMELRVDPKDASKAVLDFKSSEKRIGEALGLPGPVSAEQNNGISLGFVRAHQRAKVESGLPDDIYSDYDPKTVRMQRFQKEDGSGEWVIAGQHTSGIGSVPLLTLQDGDPRLSGYLGDLKEATDRDLRKHWFGKTAVPDPQLEGYVAGSVAGRAFGKAIGQIGGSVQGLFTDTVRGANLQTRLTDPGYNPMEGHYTKRLLDAVFGTDTRNDPRPLIDLNPMRLLPGYMPQGNADVKRIRESMEKSKDPDLEERARNIDLLMQLNNRGRTQSPQDIPSTDPALERMRKAMENARLPPDAK